MKLFSHKHRDAHLGPYPLETLARTDTLPNYQRKTLLTALDFVNQANPQSLSNAMTEYVNLMDRLRDGEVVPNKAPIPDDPKERANHLKAACYFLDASQAGTCVLPAQALLADPIRNHSLDVVAEKEYSVGASQNAMSKSTVAEGASAWQRTEDDKGIAHHSHALALLVEFPRDPDITEPGGEWLVGTQAHRAAVRAAEVAAVISQYIRFLGFEARAHTATASDVDSEQVLLAAGLAEVSNGKLVNPYLGDRFGVAVITTTLELADDKPLAARQLAEQWRAKGPSWWLGTAGTKSALKGQAFKGRAYHQGLYPMEKVKRQQETTTYIDSDNVPRIPKRGDMFVRAAIGDLGKKAQRELDGFRMITKSPFGHAMMPVLGGMVPMQYGQEAQQVAPGTDDPVKNAANVKAALHYLGADMAGICEIPDYAWYSHDHDGSEIEPYHKYAVSILVDQGYETMEGASGDDWISGAQSMRAYMRAALVGGIVCSHIRSLGYSARTHSVVDQDVLHVPLILLSGMGEMSRIGEVVLNPFVGPRFKSGILTTNMPLAVDQPVDFGLQDFCNQCKKCARECPCTAIPFGDKIMFNGYEIWKPDSEKCARYRITNSAGSMCGRCMKTCPWNLEGVLAEKPFLWAAMNLPFTREWLAEFDDKVGNGRRNPVKKWWWDLDTDKQGNILIAKRSNERELSYRPPLSPEEQTLGCYPAEDLPPPGHPEPHDVDRNQGKERYQNAETPEQYRARLAKGGSNVVVMEPVANSPVTPEAQTPGSHASSPGATMKAEVLSVTVASKTTVAEGIVSLELVSPDGGPLPPFKAGAHVDVYLGDLVGLGETSEPLVRQYSLCNDPGETHRYVIGVLLEPNSRGGSRTVHQRVQVGDRLNIGRPRNAFQLDESGKRSLLFAGGIGITPILSMAWRLHSLGADFELHYCTRSEERMAFRALLQAAPFADKVHLHFDNGPDNQKLDIDGVLGTVQEGHHVYVCGPEGFMNFVLGATERFQWPAGNVHREYFAAEAVDVSGDRPFQVKLASTGAVYTVPSDKTIAETLIEAGVEVATSCEQGMCGACLTPVLEGEAEHRDTVQTDEEKAGHKQITLCCSRARGDLLVLDL